jgi:hypothetical protein
MKMSRTLACYFSQISYHITEWGGGTGTPSIEPRARNFGPSFEQKTALPLHQTMKSDIFDHSTLKINHSHIAISWHSERGGWHSESGAVGAW